MEAGGGRGALALVGGTILCAAVAASVVWSARANRTALREAPTPPSAQAASPPIPATSEEHVLTPAWVEVPSAAPGTPSSTPSRPDRPAHSTPAIDSAHGELAAIDFIRQRVRAGDSAGALRALDAFDRRFPHARARDEATVIRIEALLKGGNQVEGQRLGREFLRTKTDSLYSAKVSHLLGDP